MGNLITIREFTLSVILLIKHYYHQKLYLEIY